MNDNSINPFQIKQNNRLNDDTNKEVLTESPTLVTEYNDKAPKKPVVALDGVSPQYNDDYSFPMPPENEPLADDGIYTDTNFAQIPPEPVATDYFASEEAISLDNQPPEPIEDTSLEPIKEITPSLEDPEEAAKNAKAEINKGKNKSSGGGTVKIWLFAVALAFALVGITGAVFFMIEYNQANTSLTELHGQIQEYRAQAESGQTAMQQLESLQSTVQEQAEKITSLKEENDSMKKTKDELKSAKEEIEKLKKEKEELVNNYAKMLPNSSN